MLWEKKKQYLSKKLRDLVRFAYDNAPSTKKRFEAVGITPEDIKSIKDLEKLPPMHKEELMERQKASPPFGGGSDSAPFRIRMDFRLSGTRL